MYQGRRYVVGKPGNEYAIRVRNQSGGRVLTVMSVDGVNAISGDTASTAQTGYVLSPYESADIAGWRKSMSNTAAFYFTTLPDSYAARTGRPDNVGVIGVAVFRERPRRVVEQPLERLDRREAARDAAEPMAKAAKPAGAGALNSEAAGRAAAEPRHRAWPQRIVVRELHPVRARQHGARADDHDLLRLVPESAGAGRAGRRAARRALAARSVSRSRPIHAGPALNSEVSRPSHARFGGRAAAAPDADSRAACLARPPAMAGGCCARKRRAYWPRDARRVPIPATNT